MATINFSDILFATATKSGRDVAHFRISGIDSINCVIEELHRLAGATCGMIQLTLRNATQGWCHSQALYLRA